MNIPLNAAMRGLEAGVSFAGDNASNGQTLNELSRPAVKSIELMLRCKSTVLLNKTLR